MITLENKQKKFVITPKVERSVTLTVRLETELNNYIEEIARKSGRSRNELINKALKFAFENLEFVMRYGSHTPCNVNKCCNSVGKEVPIEFWCPYVYDEAILRHYTTKSLEEWVTKKQVRRYPDSPPHINAHHPHLSLQFFFAINEMTKEKEKYLKSLAR